MDTTIDRTAREEIQRLRVALRLCRARAHTFAWNAKVLHRDARCETDPRQRRDIVAYLNRANTRELDWRRRANRISRDLRELKESLR